MAVLLLAGSLSFAAWTHGQHALCSCQSYRYSSRQRLRTSSRGTSNNGALASSELYNPGSGAWSYTGNMNIGRVSAQAVLLGNGTALVTGGCINNDCLSSTTKSGKSTTPRTRHPDFLNLSGCSRLSPSLTQLCTRRGENERWTVLLTSHPVVT